MNCKICDKVLQKGEAIMCSSCIDFIEWKYGSLERFEKIRNGEVKKNE
jgi:hypothetical protein